jgi:hypothetical protein
VTIRRAAVLLAAALVLTAPLAGWAAEYRMSDYRSPTPDSVPGALTVGTAEVEALWGE